MDIFNRVSDIRSALLHAKQGNKTVALVPTMGALHDGHRSLMQAALTRADILVASVFVNPTQFNEADDFNNYPRNLEADMTVLADAGCDIAFTPTVEEIYPEPDQTTYDFGELETRYEGAFRPGHFKGVAMVVRRLFNIIEPDLAFFGEKDFQQVMVIRQLVRQFNIPVEIVTVPTLREPDGLAMSSRNVRLSDAERNRANAIYKALLRAQELAPSESPEQIRHLAMELLEQNGMQPEYFDIAHPETLRPIRDFNGAPHAVALVAARLGNVRLIDNLQLF
ncbi:MAG: pantoate--beta-alanine ligase [Cryomorphaceae bacterium]|nr:MAG: pantoate--beta-alanine ligase [Cryomorphaceae bacterium]